MTTNQPPGRADSRGHDPRRVGPSRLRGWATTLAVVCAALAAVGSSVALVVAGRMAEHPTVAQVWVLVVCLVGGALVDTVGRYLWASVVDRAAGVLRSDLLDAVLGQPLATLSEQAAGEILDRVDDDTHEVSTLLRQQVWGVLRMALALVPMWIVAGVTWWPAWALFPVFGVATWFVMRPLLSPIARGKVVEEAAWTDHAAAFEEGVAGRDDVRTSLGQAFLVQRLATLSARVHERFATVLRLECRLLLRTGLTLHLLLATVVAAGALLAANSRMSVAQLVTIFLVTSGFVGLMARVAEQLPDVQAGLGALTRLRSLLASPAERAHGRPVPDGDLDVEFRGVDFTYPQGEFALQGVSLHVPAGATLALVGRTGSGKSTLAALLSRAAEPRTGTVFLGGQDVTDLDLTRLRRAVGVVTQRTEILAGTLAENIAVFADVPRARIESVIDALGLGEWVAALPDGLDTLLGPGGLVLSAGEEQLLAFARILVRDVQVVVLDEATARMDPVTEARVVAASGRLLQGRTGILVAHRLSTIARADLVAVMDAGRVAQFGRPGDLARVDGPFRTLSQAAGISAPPDAGDGRATRASEPAVVEPSASHTGARRLGAAPPPREVEPGPSLAGGMLSALRVRPSWGLVSVVAFLLFSVTGAIGGLTGWAWGRTVEALTAHDGSARVAGWSTLVILLVLLGPCAIAFAVSRYPRWWIEVSLRARMAVMIGQTGQRRLARTPPGEVVARAMDSDRFVRYADRWVDFVNGLLIVGITAVVGGSPLVGGVLLAIMLVSALASAAGRPFAGRSATLASATRARFGRALVSALEASRTIKLAGRVPEVRAHLAHVDDGRVEAAVREHRVQSVLDGVPTTMVQLGVIAAWVGVLHGTWGLATALLVVNAANNFDWFGRVAGAVVTEAPGTRSWQQATTSLAGGGDIVRLPHGVDLVTGEAPAAPDVPRSPLRSLALVSFTAVHDDGTRGVVDVDLEVARGELVMLVGQVGSGKSSLLAALAGLIHHEGELTWNGRPVDDPELFLRPGQVAHVAQAPRVLSGTFAENVALGFGRDVDASVADARMSADIRAAGGHDALVGHRGVRLSGGQVQRLALARALAADTELLLADDVSSALDARTELELWQALRRRGTTVVGATSKRAALRLADRVLVLEDGHVVAVGSWDELAGRWGHLAG